MPDNVTNLFKAVLSECTEAELKEWFYTNFHKPLDTQFMGDMTKPAEEIRHKRKQTQTIENFLLLLKQK